MQAAEACHYSAFHLERSSTRIKKFPRMRLRLEFASFSEKGARPRNEDSLRVDLESRLFLIADGLGGLHDGHVASATSIEAAYIRMAECESRSGGSDECLLDAMLHANKVLFDRNQLQH